MSMKKRIISAVIFLEAALMLSLILNRLSFESVVDNFALFRKNKDSLLVAKSVVGPK